MFELNIVIFVGLNMSIKHYVTKPQKVKSLDYNTILAVVFTRSHEWSDR